MTEATQTCAECGSELDRREGPLGVSYQCLNLECGSTFAPDEIDETAPATQARDSFSRATGRPIPRLSACDSEIQEQSQCLIFCR